MTDDKNSGFAASGLSTLWKTISSSILGLVSGAVLMYLSPLVNNAIKPPRPVANFSYAAEGMQVTFANRSTGGTQGWWDFGDGSALEPFAPSQADMVHKFPAAGSYTVKLMLTNLIGEDVERAVALRVDAGTSSTPAIQNFQAVCKSTAVPATVHLQADVKNADQVVWSIDDLPLFIDDVPSGGQLHRTVTFTYYGNKKIRLVAINGKNHVETSTDVWVDVPGDVPQMLLYATSMPTRTRVVPFAIPVPSTYGGESVPVAFERSIDKNSVIVDARFSPPPNENVVRNPQLAVASDRRSFRLQGELMRNVGGLTPSWCGNIELTLMSGSATPSPVGEPLTKSLTLPGRTVIDLPATFLDGKKGVQWELRQGMDVLMRDAKAPTTPVSQQVQMGKQIYSVQVQQVGTRLIIDTVGAPTAAVPGTNTSISRPN